MRIKARRSQGLSLVELLVGIAIASITLPIILNLLIEPLLSQLRTSALSEAEGNAKLLAMKAKQSTEVAWDSASSQLRFDGVLFPLPDGCSVHNQEDSEDMLVARCVSGVNTTTHTAEIPLLSNDPCGDSDLVPVSLPSALASQCRVSLKR